MPTASALLGSPASPCSSSSSPVRDELKGKNDTFASSLVIATLVLAWLFSNIVYALHYAHLFYSATRTATDDSGGLDIPECDEPDYWDFVYFSFTLGMTFQTSDVDITSRHDAAVCSASASPRSSSTSACSPSRSTCWAAARLATNG